MTGSSRQHPHLCCSGGVQDQDGPGQQRSRHQLAEEQDASRQRTQGHGAHVHPQVSVPPALQVLKPGYHDRPGHRHRPLHGLRSGARLAQRTG